MPFRIRVRNFQSIKDAEVEVDGFTVVTGPNNSGKALANGTSVASPTGWVPVESLRVGDLVLAGDGSPTKVVGVYPQGQRETCVITFDDGRQATVDLDHLWKVSIGQEWDVVSTRDIWDRVGNVPIRSQRPAVPIPGPAQYIHLSTPLDPYLMGLLLADLSLPQEVSLDPVLELGLVGLKAHEKFIPPVYLWNDIDTRVAVLQGLLDSNGGVNKQGIAEFHSASPFLADGVAEIVRSLGGAAQVRKKKIGRQCFTVSIHLSRFPLFRLPRKQEKVGGLSGSIQPLMVAFSKGPVVHCTCIEVEHYSHLFQMEGHLVTHNTAFLRAIGGVFANTPGTGFVRHGSKYTSVEISFQDGPSVLWKKGPGIKPSYVINGGNTIYPGRGVPQEVLDLGVKPIKAGTETLWPQIAKQFTGQVFLLNQSGSVVAEAVADVDRVGRLSRAKKMAESDKRSAESTLKVRRGDVKILEENLRLFDGLDNVASLVDDLESRLAEVQELSDQIITLSQLRDKISKMRDQVSFLSKVEDVSVPSSDKAREVGDVGFNLENLIILKTQLAAARKAEQDLSGIQDVVLPSLSGVQKARKMKDKLRDLCSLKNRLRGAQGALESISEAQSVASSQNLSVISQFEKKALKTGRAVVYFTDLLERIDKFKVQILQIEEGLKVSSGELKRVDQEASNLLDELGVCPTCGQICGEHS